MLKMLITTYDVEVFKCNMNDNYPAWPDAEVVDARRYFEDGWIHVPPGASFWERLRVLFKLR